MHESQRIRNLHKYLPSDLLVWKIQDTWHRGVADCYYSGPKGDLWVEYKSQTRTKLTAMRPRLSSLQLAWINKQSGFGRTVWVVVLTDDGHFILKDPADWERGISPGAVGLSSYKKVAAEITEHCFG